LRRDKTKNFLKIILDFGIKFIILFHMDATIIFSTNSTFGFACVALELTSTAPYMLDSTGLAIWADSEDITSIASILDESGVEAEDFTVVKKTADEYEIFRAALDAEAERMANTLVPVATVEFSEEQE
jgi:hypothetical protein